MKENREDIVKRMKNRFARLYGEKVARACGEKLSALLKNYRGKVRGDSSSRWDETSTVLITYGDMVQKEGERPLGVLKRFLDEWLKGTIRAVHILPFFPYSSDDGFSVIDYREVNPDLGEWGDVRAMATNFDLMFDLVLNHVSRKSQWVQDFVDGRPPYSEFFLDVDPGADLSHVVRPRNTPLLTPVQTSRGEKHLWATFSADQIDLNFAEPAVLFEFFHILLFYISQGATIIRLDAIAYLWKKIGTPCIHLEETHEVVKLFRDLLDLIAPRVILLTETNVPHNENLSYFGNQDEAHMVYQFSLPPLLLHAIHSGSTRYLTQWASTLSGLPGECAVLNFTASHDGIGVRPLQGLIPEEELESLLQAVREKGGKVSYKRNSDGTESPYELNITYFDACSGENPDAQVARFLLTQTVALGLQGVPAIYFHSLTATRNDLEGVERTGRARSINRMKWEEEELSRCLADASTVTARVFKEYIRRIRVRREQAAFHPSAGQRVLDLGPSLFAFLRIAQDKTQTIACASNFSPEAAEVELAGEFSRLCSGSPFEDLLSGRRYQGGEKTLSLGPFETVWLTFR